jgi:hypothetical protein
LVDRLACQRRENTVKVKGRKRRHLCQLIQRKIVVQVIADIVDDEVDTLEIQILLGHKGMRAGD